MKKIVIQNERHAIRLDSFLVDQSENQSRSQIQRQIMEGCVKVNGKLIQKKNFTLSQGDEIEFSYKEDVPLTIEAENIPIEVVYEDDVLMVVNKPQGMVVHPSPGHYSGTLVNALLGLGVPLSQINGSLRPGIVHRIDRDTSGLLMIAKTDEAHESLASQLKEKTTYRVYHCIVNGCLKEDQGTVKTYMGRHPNQRKKRSVLAEGKEAITHYRCIERLARHTYLSIQLETGRTHQIRVHMNYIGYPVVGDPIYGLKSEPVKFTGQLLHAQSIGFIHPVTQEKMVFEADEPQYFKEILAKCRQLKK